MAIKRTVTQMPTDWETQLPEVSTESNCDICSCCLAPQRASWKGFSNSEVEGSQHFL